MHRQEFLKNLKVHLLLVISESPIVFESPAIACPNGVESTSRKSSDKLDLYLFCPNYLNRPLFHLQNQIYQIVHQYLLLQVYQMLVQAAKAAALPKSDLAKLLTAPVTP
jgi:hypothetical protein